MNKKDLKKKEPLTNVKSSSGLVTLKYNNNFCSKFFERNKIATIVDEPQPYGAASNLVYNIPKSPESNLDLFQTIIDLLLQLRASQSDQNVIVQNNTVLRENILKQLKSEMLRVSHKLTNNQIKNLEVISSNNFDEDTLTDILKSFLESSKKKLAIGETKAQPGKDSKEPVKTSLIKNASRYLKLSGETTREEKLFKTVSNKFVYRKSVHTQEAPESEQETNPEKQKVSEEFYTKLIENPAVKKLLIKRSKELEIPFEEVKTTLVKSSKLLMPLVKIQTDLIESEVLKKARSFTKKFVSKNITKLAPTQEELVNKILVKTNINELKENLARNYERYDYFTSKHQNEIRRIQTDVKKLQKLATVTYDKNYLVKSVSAIDLNTRNKIQKNIIKMVSGRQLVSKFENISENFFQDYIQKKSTRHSSFINKVFESQIKSNLNERIYDKTDLRHKVINLSEDSVKEVSKHNVLAQKINKKHSERQKVNENFALTEKEHFDKYHLKQINLNSTNEKLREFVEHKIENKIENNKTIERSSKKQLTSANHKQFSEFVSLTKLLDLRKDNLEKINITKDLSQVTKLASEKVYLKNINLSSEAQKLIEEVTSKTESKISKKNVSKITQVQKNLIEEKIIKNTKNINLTKTPLVFSLLSTIIDSKIGKVSVNPAVTKKSLDVVFRNDRPQTNEVFEKNRFLSDKSYIVYKNAAKAEKKQEPKAEKPKEIEQARPKDIVIEKRNEVLRPEVMDAKAVERKIRERTMGKKEIVDLIESYIKDINIENISEIIMDKVESQMMMDRRRNGVF